MIPSEWPSVFFGLEWNEYTHTYLEYIYYNTRNDVIFYCAFPLYHGELKVLYKIPHRAVHLLAHTWLSWMFYQHNKNISTHIHICTCLCAFGLLNMYAQNVIQIKNKRYLKFKFMTQDKQWVILCPWSWNSSDIQHLIMY